MFSFRGPPLWSTSIFLFLPQLSSPAVLYTSSSLVVRRQDSNVIASGAFRQNISNHAKMPHPGQSHNLVIYMRAYVKHNSRSGGCEFDLPNRPFLSPFYTPDIFVHALSCRVRDFSRYNFSVIYFFFPEKTKKEINYVKVVFSSFDFLEMLMSPSFR